MSGGLQQESYKYPWSLVSAAVTMDNSSSLGFPARAGPNPSTVSMAARADLRAGEKAGGVDSCAQVPTSEA